MEKKKEAHNGKNYKGFTVRKVISFCLHSGHTKYCQGFLENLPLAKEFYPGWDVVLFYDNTLPSKWLAKYDEAGVESYNVHEYGIHPTCMRFLAHELPNVERFISRDADSRLSQREAEAVKEWEDSGVGLHSMRDHPHHDRPHYPIFGGMFGLVVSELGDFNMREKLIEYSSHCPDKRGGHWQLWKKRKRGLDMIFLRENIYPIFDESGSIMIHTICKKRFPFEVDFPSPRNKNKNFVGEIIDYRNGDPNRRVRGPQWKHL
jgi:hypothetical protein